MYRGGQGITRSCSLRDRTEYGHANEFANYMRMDGDLFLSILERLEPILRRRDMPSRRSVSPCEQLAITLRHLATVQNYPDLQFAYVWSRDTIYLIIPRVCDAIVNVLGGQMIRFPSSEVEWRAVADRFLERWNLDQAAGQSL